MYQRKQIRNCEPIGAYDKRGHNLEQKRERRKKKEKKKDKKEKKKGNLNQWFLPSVNIKKKSLDKSECCFRQIDELYSSVEKKGFKNIEIPVEMFS